MNRMIFVLFGVLFLVLLTGSLQMDVFARDALVMEENPQPEWISAHEVLVRFTDEVSWEDVDYWMKQRDLQLDGVVSGIDVWRGMGTETAVSRVLSNEFLQYNDDVLWLEPNHVVYAADIVPNDNFYNAQQENLRVIGLPSAWELTTGERIPVAIIDTGVDLDHPDLVHNIWVNSAEIPDNAFDDDGNGFVDDVVGWDFVNDDSIPQDDNSHGSFVAGIVAAQSNNVTGIAGVSWYAQIVSLKVLNNVGTGNSADVAEAIIYAADNGVSIINLSLETELESQVLADAVDYAVNEGCLLIAAVGNGGGAVAYPAKFPDVLAVSATNNNDVPWTFSNQGAEVDIAAPGVDIFSTNRLGSYSDGLNGTSFAAPHVAGVAALVMSVDSQLTAVQVRQILITTSTDVWSPGWDLLTGWGRLDADAALRKASEQQVYLPLVVAN